MSTTPSPHPSFSIPPFTQLVQRLRHTNARYKQIAHQCRRTQRPMYHAKRRAYRAGLSIDTSKARAAWPGQISCTASESSQLCLVSDRTAGGPLWGTEAGANDSGESVEDACMPSLVLGHCSPEVVMEAQEQPLASCHLSPLRLELVSFGFGSSLRHVNVDDSVANAACNPPCSLQGSVRVPGAPRWRSIPLPEDVHAMDWDAPMAFATQPSLVSCTDGNPDVWRYVSATDVSDSMSTSVHYAGLGITLPLGHPKWTL